MAESESCSVVSDSLWSHGLYSQWNSPDQNTGVGSLLQGIFPTQGSNPSLPCCRQIIYQLSHKGSPRILEWVAIPSPGDLPDLPGVSCIAGGFFTNWSTRETLVNWLVTSISSDDLLLDMQIIEIFYFLSLTCNHYSGHVKLFEFLFLKSLLNLLQHCFWFVFWFFGLKVCRILAPWSGMEPASPALEREV